MENPFAQSANTARNRNIAIGITVTVLLLCAGVFFFMFNGKGTVTIKNTDPIQSVITLNDQSVQTSKAGDGVQIPAYPGLYRLKITKTDYLPFVQDINVRRGQNVTIRPAFAFIPKMGGTSSVQSVQFVQPTSDGSSILYLGNGGTTIYRMDLSTQVPQAITQAPLSGVLSINWSAQPDVALIMKKDGVYLQEIPSYDLLTQATRKIAGSEFEYATWDPTDSNRLAVAYYPSSGERSLMFSDKSGTPGERKADLTGIDKPKLIWSPDSRFIAVIARSNDQARNHLWLYTLANGSFVQLSQDSGVADASFSPDGSTILYQASGNSLSTIGSDGSNLTRLSGTGMVSRTAWHDNASFFMPNPSNGNLILRQLGGQDQDLNYIFANLPEIQGMNYFSNQQTLLFYTADTLYSVNVGI